MTKKITKNIDNKRITKGKIKRFFFGMNTTDGKLFKIVLYALLIIVSFIFLYPLLFMLFTSFKQVEELADTSVGLLPSKLFFENYKTAAKELNYFPSLWKTIVIALIPSLLNTIIGCLTAYGFAKFNFPLKKFLFGLMIASFVIPTVLITIPQYAWYSKLNLLGSIWTYILPSLFGQGLYSTLYILILYSTFKQIPKQLEESGKIDGANNLQIFFKIILPLVIPSLITVFLFSFVWYWNDSVTAAMYLNVGGKNFWVTLPVALQNYQSAILAQTQGGQRMVLYQGIKMAGTLITILPLLILYLFLQKYFVEGIEKSGITGE